MKNIFLTTLSFLLILSSCTKKIDLDLKEDEHRTVINSRLYLGTNDFKVNVTKSGNYFGKGSITNVTNAVITLHDGTVSHSLTNSGQGNYTLSSFTAVANQEYKLTITENGKIHEAKAIMPQVVPLDSIIFEYQPAFGPRPAGYLAYTDGQDPANIKNYYKIEFKVNGEVTESERSNFIILQDDWVDGNRLIFPVINGLDKFDTLQMDLMSIDKGTYNYYNQLSLAIDGDGAAPTNPDNNFGKDVLGNFSVMAVSSRTGVAK